MAISRLGLSGVGRQRYAGFIAKSPSLQTRGITRLSLMGIGQRKPLAGSTIAISGNIQPNAATISGTLLGDLRITRLGLSGIGRERYKGFIAKTPTSAATRTLSGSPQAQAASITATLINGKIVSGAIQPNAASISATMVRQINIDGSRRGWLNPLGNPDWFNSNWFIDAMRASRATASTATLGTKQITGAMQASPASFTATISRGEAIAVAIQASNASVDGNLDVIGAIGIGGNLQASPATVDNTTLIWVGGRYAIQASPAQMSGGIEVTGSIALGGNMQASGAQIDGDTIDRQGFRDIIGAMRASPASVTARFSPVWRDEAANAVTWDNEATSGSIAWNTASNGANLADYWQTQTQLNTSNINIRSIWYDDNTDTWVACGDGGVIYVRHGEGGWNTITPIISSSLRTVKKWNNLWVACGVGGEVITSSDAITWTQVYFDLNSAFVTIAFNDDRIIIGGTYWVSGVSRGLMLYSTNGTSWTRSTNTDLSYGYALLYSEDLGAFLFSGEGSGDTPRLYQTTTGADYTRITGDGGFATSIWALDYDGTNYVGGTGYGEVRYSSNSTDWNASTATDIAGEGVWRIVNNGDVLVMCGGYPTGKVLKSADNGVTWELVYTNGDAYRMSKAAYSVQGGYWLAIGWNGQCAKSISNETWTDEVP